MAVTGNTKLGPSVKNYAAADQGAYYTFTDTTPGTGQVSTVQTTLADTKPYLLIFNGNTVASGVNLYMDFFKVACSVAGVGHTGGPFWTLKVDRAQTVNRYTSGGAALTPQASNAGASNASGNAKVYIGAITAAAAGTAATLASHLTKPGHIEIVGDTSTFDFGAPEQQPQDGLADNSTTISHGLFNFPPVVIGPQMHLALHYWGGSMSTGTTFYVNGGFWEI